MGISDDLVPVLGSKGEPGVRFRQGTVTAWNAATGQNTIDVAGGELVDVPMLGTGEAVTLKAGHVVGLIGQGMTWFIVGRIIPANDPAFAGASVAFDSATAQATNFALSTSIATKGSVTINVPAWADEAAVVLTGACTALNPNASVDSVSAQAFIAGDGGPATSTGIGTSAGGQNQHVQALSANHARVVTSPGATILCELKMRSLNFAMAAAGTNVASLSAMAIFRSTV